MGIFNGIGDARVTQGGAYIVPGKHTFIVRSLQTPPKLRAGDCFIAELEVVKSTSDEYVEGQSVSWVRNISKHREMALADIKGFLSALSGLDPEDIDEKGAEAATSNKQPFAGYQINCEAFNKTTKAGGEFTRTIWHQAS